jgi:hypothetical protein
MAERPVAVAALPRRKFVQGKGFERAVWARGAVKQRTFLAPCLLDSTPCHRDRQSTVSAARLMCWFHGNRMPQKPIKQEGKVAGLNLGNGLARGKARR